MLAPVLTVEQNDPVTLGKHDDTRGKENKETGNEYALKYYGIVLKILENSTSKEYKKAGSVTEVRECSFLPSR